MAEAVGHGLEKHLSIVDRRGFIPVGNDRRRLGLLTIPASSKYGDKERDGKQAQKIRSGQMQTEIGHEKTRLVEESE
ncbi:MAG: hypothetical protein ACNA7E_10010, partial [Wenzhouxiangellaceae bacterium]